MKVKNAYKALIILMFITITISGYEFLTAIKNFNPNGTIFDFCNGAIEYIPYFMIFLLVLFLVLPISLLLFKENSIQLKSAILDKKHLLKDILYGIILGLISEYVVYLFFVFRSSGSNYEHTMVYNNSITFYILYFLSLSLVCGILKELYFRGFAKFFLADIFGENFSYLLTAILFGIVDWQNMGSSVILGLLWGFAYKKNGRLIVPMIAHGLINALGIIGLFIL